VVVSCTALDFFCEDGSGCGEASNGQEDESLGGVHFNVLCFVSEIEI